MCNEAADDCVAPDNSSCNDGDLCTQADTCQGGVCVGSNPVICGTPCTPGLDCDPVAYKFTEIPDTGSYNYFDEPHNVAINGVGQGLNNSGYDQYASGQLLDGEKGADAYWDDKGNGPAYEWVGWLNKPAAVIFRFPTSRNFTTVTIGISNSTASIPDVVEPVSVTVSFSDDGFTFGSPLLFEQSNSTLPHIPDGTRADVTLDLTGRAGRFARLDFANPYWTFIDEVAFGPSALIDPCSPPGNCNPLTGLCAPPPPLADGTDCSDGTFCNGADKCSAGACTAHAGDPCSSGAECQNVCNESLGNCVAPDNSPCDDGLFCTLTDACGGGLCLGGGDPCAGGPECANACDEANNSCNVTGGTGCTDDGNPCSLDQCDGLGSCNHPAGNPGALCRSAANECDVADTCTGSSTACPADLKQPAATPCSSDGNVCTSDQCDGVGTCTHDPGNAGLVCGAAGTCEIAPTCTGTSAACPPPALANAGSGCDDGSQCTVNDQCTAGGQCVGTPLGNCCGDGVLSTGEQCDDGNNTDGDGCNSTCRYELIPGNGAGSAARDKRACLIEWSVVNPNNTPALDRRGRPNYTQTCHNNDPTCDFGSDANACEFRVVACLNNIDARLPTCPQLGVADPVRIVLPSLLRDAANYNSLNTALHNLRDWTTGATGLQPTVESSQIGLCSAPFTVRVPLRLGARITPGRITLATMSKSYENSPLWLSDSDRLVLVCAP
ncbi:MAG: hypothetical protein HY699_14645 [Deltaproteobacteria bacterium]|nr:hypothetical protein [Deltaproteobacteria bacterium]